MVRYEFGPSSGGRLALWLSEGILPGPSCDGLWVARTGWGGLSTRRIACHTFDVPASVRTGRPQAEGRINLPDTSGYAARIVTSAPCGAAWMAARQATPCFQVDDVPMANPRFSSRHSGGAEAPSRRYRV